MKTWATIGGVAVITVTGAAWADIAPPDTCETDAVGTACLTEDDLAGTCQVVDGRKTCLATPDGSGGGAPATGEGGSGGGNEGGGSDAPTPTSGGTSDGGCSMGAAPFAGGGAAGVGLVLAGIVSAVRRRRRAG